MKFTIGKNKLANIVFLTALVGILPFAFVGWISVDNSKEALNAQIQNQLVSVRDIKKAQIEQFFQEREGDMGVLVETVNTLRSEAINKLIAVREVKRAAVKRYFQTIQNQIITFSEDQMVVDATRQFGSAFRSFRKDNSVSAEEFERMKQKLFT